MRRPDYKLVAVFFAIALGWVSLVALALFVAGASKLSFGAALAAQLTVGFVYMPAPLVAALIVERMAGRGYLVKTTFRGFLGKLARLVLTSTAVVLGVYGLMVIGVFLLGNALHVPGVGAFVLTPEGLAANIGALLGPAAQHSMAGSGKAPAPAMLLAIGGPAGLAAGLSVNGVFAFGEEYGWRGWLMDELEPIGPVRANLLTGVLWGLWHAPLILMGFNFEPYRIAGVFFMCGLTTSLSFLLWRARQFTGSLLAPAVIHGAFNGFQGFLVLLIVARNPLVSAPAGVLGWTAIGLVAATLWAVSSGHLRAEPPAAAGSLPEGGTIPAA
ncbi:MAG TPA: CPBP family intramembrane glutamic endopeptidase [Coriobacteriia bacterium]